MQAAKEKISNMASAAKEHLTICRAKLDEKAEKASARTHEEKKMAKERRKAREARAKMELHQARAKHAAHKYTTAHHHVPAAAGAHHHHGYAADKPGLYANPVPGAQVPPPVGTVAPMAGATVPTYPLGGHPPARDYVI